MLDYGINPNVLFRNMNGHRGTIDNPRVPTGTYKFDIKGLLHGCSKYDIALGVKVNTLPRKDWLYSSKRVLTLPNEGKQFTSFSTLLLGKIFGRL